MYFNKIMYFNKSLSSLLDHEGLRGVSVRPRQKKPSKKNPRRNQTHPHKTLFTLPRFVLHNPLRMESTDTTTTPSPTATMKAPFSREDSKLDELAEKMDQVDIGTGKEEQGHGDETQKMKGKEKAGVEDLAKEEGKEEEEEKAEKEEEKGEFKQKKKKGKKKSKKKLNNEESAESQKPKGGWSVFDLQPSNERERGYTEWLQNLARNIPGTKILTYNGGLFCGKLDMVDDRIMTMSKKQLDESFGMVFDGNVLRTIKIASIIVRQFCMDEIDAEGIPFKNIYAYAIGGEGQVFRLPPEVNRDVCCTDASTGRRLPPETACRYC